MKLFFSDEQIQQQLNFFDFEDITFTAVSIEGEGRTFKMIGAAVIDGENYPDFEIEFETESEPTENTIEAILDCDWEWYDFLF